MAEGKKRQYDLEKRLTKLSIAIIRLCRQIPKDVVSLPIIRQIVRSGTSIGANYTEANGASSRKDFRNKIFIAKKEARETYYWLTLLPEIDNEHHESTASISDEVHQIILILQKIGSALSPEDENQ